MKTIKGHPRVRGFSKEENKRRYVIHKELRKLGFKISTASRTVFLPIEIQIESQDKRLIELRNIFGYSLQTEAFSV